MKKHILIIALTLVTVGLVLMSSSFAQAQQTQGSNEFSIPLTDPAKRGKLKAHLNYGSITVKGTARKDVLVKYSVDEDDDEDRKHGRNHNNNGDKPNDGLKRISGGGMD